MDISELLANRIAPFEIADEKLKRLFSYYLHLAPTIESAFAAAIPSIRIQQLWVQVVGDLSLTEKEFRFYKVGNIKQNQLAAIRLSDTNRIEKKGRRMICYYKDTVEQEIPCLLRHLRNAIAHGNVFGVLSKNRKYILFDDYNKSGNHTARVLFTQTDLEKIRRRLK